MKKKTTIALLGSVLITGCSAMGGHDADGMSFFVTSAGPGQGANLGGLAGADAHCQQLATAAGAGDKTWHAYLSATGENARDRIGEGPWLNARGVRVAASVSELHSDQNRLTKQTALSEKGEIINGRGDTPNRHDILTGSSAQGIMIYGKTCNDWTSSGAGSAIVGHHDRMGLNDDAASKSWNSSHDSRGCSQSDLQSTGGDGLLYCFAVH